MSTVAARTAAVRANTGARDRRAHAQRDRDEQRHRRQLRSPERAHSHILSVHPATRGLDGLIPET
jgi:hypothetical protein